MRLCDVMMRRDPVNRHLNERRAKPTGVICKGREVGTHANVMVRRENARVNTLRDGRAACHGGTCGGRGWG